MALQFVMWYRLPRVGREEEAVQQGPLVPIITHGDCPAPPAQASLPQVIRLEDGRQMRRRKSPVAVQWGPQFDFTVILMLKVFEYLKKIII